MIRERDIAARGEPVWMEALRAEAFERFAEMRWPTTQEEEWRRSDLSELDLDGFRIRAAPAPPPAGWSGVLRFAGPVCREAALDGKLRASGVVFAPLAGAIADHPDVLRDLFRRSLDEIDNRLQAWHLSFWSHGAFLFIPAGVEIEAPFLVDCAGGEAGTISSPHVAVVLEDGARASLALRLEGPAEGKTLLNAGIRLVVGRNAKLEFVDIQAVERTSLFFHHGVANVERDGVLRHIALALGSGFAKTRLDCRLDGPGSEVQLRGAYLCRDAQHKDIRTVLRHVAPHATSRAFYKGAVRDAGRAVYQGLIEVCPSAAKTDAYLSNKNLILNDGARADSIPSLRIQTNDVRCTHGSTTGKLNEAEIFYLMSRGIARPDAEEMLALAFFEDVLADVPAAIQEDLRSRSSGSTASSMPWRTDARTRRPLSRGARSGMV